MAKGKVIGKILGSIFEGVEADGGQTFFLSQEDQAKLATRLNTAIDLPFFGETAEQAIFIKVVRALDKNTFRFIPKEILQVAFTEGKALPVEIVDAIRQSLPAILVHAVQLPFVPPVVRDALVNAFLSPLLTALGTGHVLSDLLNKHA